MTPLAASPVQMQDPFILVFSGYLVTWGSKDFQMHLLEKRAAVEGRYRVCINKIAALLIPSACPVNALSDHSVDGWFLTPHEMGIPKLQISWQGSCMRP